MNINYSTKKFISIDTHATFNSIIKPYIKKNKIEINKSFNESKITSISHKKYLAQYIDKTRKDLQKFIIKKWLYNNNLLNFKNIKLYIYKNNNYTNSFDIYENIERYSIDRILQAIKNNNETDLNDLIINRILRCPYVYNIILFTYNKKYINVIYNEYNFIKNVNIQKIVNNKINSINDILVELNYYYSIQLDMLFKKENDEIISFM